VTTTADDATAVCNEILLTCKAYDLDAAIASVAPVLTPTGYLALLNGIAHAEVLNQHFGRDCRWHQR